MILQNPENLRHFFLTPLYFKVTVICEHSIDFHETFTDGLKLMEVLACKFLQIHFKNSKSYSKFYWSTVFFGPQCSLEFQIF